VVTIADCFLACRMGGRHSVNRFSPVDVVVLAINNTINFVSHVIVAFAFGEANIVGFPLTQLRVPPANLDGTLPLRKICAVTSCALKLPGAHGLQRTCW